MADNLVSLKRSKQDKNTDEVTSPEESLYPWGATLHLENETLDKLGMNDMPKLGDTMMLMARVQVESVSEHEHSGDDGPRRSVSLQLTDMDLQPEKQVDMARALYGKGEA